MQLKRIVRHKFNAKKTEIDNQKFPSKKEAAYYLMLKKRVENGEVLFFMRQCPFHLPSGIIYRIDFIEFWADGTVHFTDVKGFSTKEYKLKKRLIEEFFPITVEEQ